MTGQASHLVEALNWLEQQEGVAHFLTSVCGFIQDAKVLA